LKTQDRGQKTNPNEPKNEAGMMLKTLEARKNEPENEAVDLIENKGRQKNKPKTNRRI
jgi:hypothetical protein